MIPSARDIEDRLSALCFETSSETESTLVTGLSIVSCFFFSLSLSFERFEKEKWKKHFSENKKEFVSFYSISIYIDLFAFKLIIKENLTSLLLDNRI